MRERENNSTEGFVFEGKVKDKLFLLLKIERKGREREKEEENMSETANE